VSFPPHAQAPSVSPSTADGFVLGPDEGEAFWWLGTLTINKIRGTSTAGGLDVVEHRVAPGYAPPRHVHQGQDEIFYVVDGEFVIRPHGSTCRHPISLHPTPLSWSRHPEHVVSTRPETSVCGWAPVGEGLWPSGSP
jgi:hypothetical protein